MIIKNNKMPRECDFTGSVTEHWQMTSTYSDNFLIGVIDN